MKTVLSLVLVWIPRKVLDVESPWQPFAVSLDVLLPSSVLQITHKSATASLQKAKDNMLIKLIMYSFVIYTVNLNKTQKIKLFFKYDIQLIFVWNQDKIIYFKENVQFCLMIKLIVT